MPFGGMQQRVRAQDAIQRLGSAEEYARPHLSDCQLEADSTSGYRLVEPEAHQVFSGGKVFGFVK